MMNFQDKLQTTAPSIRYEGDIRPEQAQIRQQQAQAMQQMQQQAMMQQQQGMMQQQGRMPAGRMPPMAMGGSITGPTIQGQSGIAGLNMPGYAYGGITGQDGRKQYGVGSWFQKLIMDPIKNATIGEAASKAASDARVAMEDAKYGKNYTPGYETAMKNFFGGEEVILKDKDGNVIIDEKTGKPMTEKKGGLSSIFNAGTTLPMIGGAVAGLFSDRLNSSDDTEADRGVGIGIQNVGKVANLLDVQQGQNAGLRFLPEVSTRKYSPAEMALSYADTTTEPIAAANLADGGRPFQMDMPNYEQNVMDPNMMEQIQMLVQGLQNQGLGMEEIKEQVMMKIPNMTMGFAEGGGIGSMMEEQSEMLNLGGMEKDYREEGGFVPIGEYEKKDDVPARLSVNEFVFTADAVRGAGDGDIDKGAERLQGIMKELEKQGKPEGMEMMEVSERLSEVV